MSNKNETDGMSFESFGEEIRNKNLTAPAYELSFDQNGDLTVKPVDDIESLPLGVQLAIAYSRISSYPEVQAILRLLEESGLQACEICPDYDQCSDPNKQPR